MEQRVSLITVGVSDLARARRFYEHLGWRGQEVEETVFFQAGTMAVVLWGRAQLADDAGVSETELGPLTLAHNVRSRAEVDRVLADAVDAGAGVTQPARETSYGGYAGYFRDPDGHLWEIAFNPGFTLDADGALILPAF